MISKSLSPASAVTLRPVNRDRIMLQTSSRLINRFFIHFPPQKNIIVFPVKPEKQAGIPAYVFVRAWLRAGSTRYIL